MQKNSVHTAVINSYSSECDGICKIDGIATFVKGALFGETVEVKIIKVARNCAWARLLKVIHPSLERIKPQCANAMACGGCRLQHMSYDEELRAKLLHVNDVFERIGKINFKVEIIHGANDVFRYRNKATFPVGQDKSSQLKIGVFQSRSHNIIDIKNCLIQSKEAEAVIAIIRKWMVENNISAYNEIEQTGLIRHIFIRTNYCGEVLVCLVTTKNKIPCVEKLIGQFESCDIQIVGLVQNIQDKNTNVIMGQSFNTLWKSSYITDKIMGLKFSLSVASFFQVNRDQAEILYSLALEFAGIEKTDNVVDLYCGTGTITLLMAQSAKTAIGVEIVPQAIDDANNNAKLNQINNVEFICQDAKSAAKDFANKNFKPDIICVDPPRKGLDQNTVNSIIQMSPKKIVYISCDPATLARDLRIFHHANYKLAKAEAVDMFPRTPHVECITLLVR